MQLRRGFHLFTVLALVLAIPCALVFGIDGVRREHGLLAAAALVAGAVFFAASTQRGGMLGEFTTLYGALVVAISAWALSEFEHGGSVVAAGGLVAASILAAVRRPPSDDEDSEA